MQNIISKVKVIVMLSVW